jgi:hypothetical protein
VAWYLGGQRGVYEVDGAFDRCAGLVGVVEVVEAVVPVRYVDDLQPGVAGRLDERRGSRRARSIAAVMSSAAAAYAPGSYRRWSTVTPASPRDATREA